MATYLSISANENSVFRKVGILIGTFLILCVCIMVPFTHCHTLEKVALAIWTVTMGAISIMLFSRTSSNPMFNRMITLCAFSLTFAFPFKAILSQSQLSRDQVMNFGIPHFLFKESLYPAIAYTLGAIFALAIITHLSCRGQFSQPKKDMRLNYSLIFLAIAVSLLIKFVAQYILVWGVPNVPTRNEIPLVTGATVMYCKLGVFHLINVAIATAVITRTSFANKIGIGILTIGYLGLDFGLGSKYSLVYIIIAGVFSVAISTIKIRFNWNKAVAMAVVALLAISLYPIIHNFRFAKRQIPNGTPTQILQRSVEMTLQKTNQNLVLASIFAVSKRINGFQNHAAAVLHKDKLNVSWDDMISSADTTRKYTIAVTGIRHESNAYGITQSGMLSMQFKNSLPPIFIGSLLLNLFVAGGVTWVAYYCCKNRSNWYAAGISLGLFLVYFQFQGGNLSFVGKQFLVIALTMYLSNFMFQEYRRVPLGSITQSESIARLHPQRHAGSFTRN